MGVDGHKITQNPALLAAAPMMARRLPFVHGTAYNSGFLSVRREGMSITIEVQRKEVKTNVVRAFVSIVTDEVFSNPSLIFGQPSTFNRLCQVLGVKPDEWELLSNLLTGSTTSGFWKAYHFFTAIKRASASVDPSEGTVNTATGVTGTFALVEGPTGPLGPTGPVGPVGPTGPAGSSLLPIQKGGVTVGSRAKLNFIGTSVTVEDNSVNDRIDVTLSGGGGSLIVQSDGVSVGSAEILNFETPGIVTTYNSGSSRIDVHLALTADPEVISPAFAVSFYNNSALVEAGDSRSSPSFSAIRNYTATTVTLTNTANAESVNVTSAFNGGTAPSPSSPTQSANFSSAQTYTFASYGAQVTWTLTANRSGIIRTATATFTAAQKVFVGVAAVPGSYNESFIESLTGTLALTKNGTYSVNAGSGQRVYFAYRAAYGSSTFVVGGFAGGFTQVATVNVTNSFSVTESYRLFESDTANLGAISFTVS